MYIILLALFLILYFIPHEIIQWFKVKRMIEADERFEKSLKPIEDVIMTNCLGIEGTICCGGKYRAAGYVPSIRTLTYPIGSQEAAFLDAVVLYRLYIDKKDDEWLIIEVEERGSDWLLFGCHRSSGASGERLGWHWDCTTLSSLEELRKSICEKQKLCLAVDFNLKAGERTLRSFIFARNNGN